MNILYYSITIIYLKPFEKIKLNDPIDKFPIFIPSITSIKNFHNYFELVNIVLDSNITAFMFSALDIAYYFKNEFERVEKIVKKANEKIIFLDSGGFEKYNIPYYRKQWEIQDLISIAEKINPQIIVAFDIISNIYKNNHFKDLYLFKNTLELAEGIINVKKKFEVIIHSFSIEKIFLYLQKLMEYDEFIYAIGIPERNLGESFRIRLINLKQISNFIRNSLNWHSVHLHLFGCSNPSNMIEYSKKGIDIFDGVHWQDLIINPLNGCFLGYSNLLKINCNCRYCLEYKKLINENHNNEEKYYNFYAINHNLEFYRNIWG